MKEEETLLKVAELLSTQAQHVPSTVRRMQKEIEELDKQIALLKK